MTLFISVQNCSFSKAQFVLRFNIGTGRPNKIWKGKNHKIDQITILNFYLINSVKLKGNLHCLVRLNKLSQFFFVFYDFDKLVGTA